MKLERRLGNSAARYLCVVCGTQAVLAAGAEHACPRCGVTHLERYEARRHAPAPPAPPADVQPS